MAAFRSAAAMARPPIPPEASRHKALPLAARRFFATNRAYSCPYQVERIPRWRARGKLERAMTDNPRLIENKIAELRELMRCTLDRTKLPLLREQLMAEIVKLNALGGQS
jgi:hypothetical protein